MKRAGWLERKTALPRGGRVKPRNDARRKKEFARCYHSEARVQFVRSLPCCVCGGGPCDNAHYVGAGMSRKASYDAIVPLCTLHHHELHTVGVGTFSVRHDTSLIAHAALTQKAWLRESGE